MTQNSKNEYGREIVSKYKIIAETEIEVEADNEEEAFDAFYDNVYEVSRSGCMSILLMEGPEES